MIIAVLLTFVAVFLLILTVFLGVTAAKDSPTSALKRRMRRMATTSTDMLPFELRSEIAMEVSPFEKILAKIPILRNLEYALDRAGLNITVAVYLPSLVAITLLSAGLIYIIFHKLFLAPIAVIAVIAGSSFFLSYKKNARAELFTDQMPEVLDMISRSLRSGHSMTSAVELVGQEMPNPAGELFKTAYDQQNLGLRITETLSNMTYRIDSMDLRFFITSVQINAEVGGNLAEVLDNLAAIIRERLKIRRQVQVYTAQGRMSGYVLSALPIAAFFLVKMMMPAYVGLLTSTNQGITMLVVAGVMQTIGFFVIRKIVHIRI